MILKAILYENQAIYIISSVGEQSKETFTKIEEIVTRMGKTSASIRSLKDIVEKETVKTPTNKTGFAHNPAGYHVEFYNGSEIFTLNSNPDNARSNLIVAQCLLRRSVMSGFYFKRERNGKAEMLTRVEGCD